MSGGEFLRLSGDLHATESKSTAASSTTCKDDGHWLNPTENLEAKRASGATGHLCFVDVLVTYVNIYIHFYGTICTTCYNF